MFSAGNGKELPFGKSNKCANSGRDSIPLLDSITHLAQRPAGSTDKSHEKEERCLPKWGTWHFTDNDTDNRELWPEWGSSLSTLEEGSFA